MKTVLFTRQTGVYQIGDAASFDNDVADSYVKKGSAENTIDEKPQHSPATLESLKRNAQMPTGQIKA